jgi:hypothetical protein
MPAPLYWSVTVIGFISLGFALATTAVLFQDGWSWELGILALTLYSAAFDFLYAAFGPPGHWPTVLWFWPW